MSALSQIAAVSAMNIRSLPQRVGTSSVVVIGIAGVVAVLISVLAMSTGLIKTLEKTGPVNRAIVVRTGSSAELTSVLTNDAALAIADSAGIKKGADGHPLASPEGLLIVNVLKKRRHRSGGTVSRPHADRLCSAPGNQARERPLVPARGGGNDRRQIRAAFVQGTGRRFPGKAARHDMDGGRHI